MVKHDDHAMTWFDNGDSYLSWYDHGKIMGWQPYFSNIYAEDTFPIYAEDFVPSLAQVSSIILYIMLFDQKLFV